MTTREAADYIGVSWRMMEKLRNEGGGPRFLKVGRKIIYDRLEIDRWIERKTVDRRSA